MIHIGPLTLAWHGITIALGILVGGGVAGYYARERGLAADPLYTIGMILVLGALVGGRLYYLAERGDLLDSGEWLGTRGFTFYGGFIAAAVGIGVYLWRARLSVAYLDVVAVGLPLGIAIGRIGDVINGEHYGPATDFFLGVRNKHPDADVPSPYVAYHSGGLYEVLIGAIVFAIVWPLGRFTFVDRPQTFEQDWQPMQLSPLAMLITFFSASSSWASTMSPSSGRLNASTSGCWRSFS